MNRSIIKIKENPDAGTSIEIVPAGGAVWMTKSEIARLLVVYQNTISNNLRTIFKAGILKEKDVVREHKYKTQGIERITVYYSLEVIIALCYRIRSRDAKIFREHMLTRFCNDMGNRIEYDIRNKLIFSLN